MLQMDEYKYLDPSSLPIFDYDHNQNGDEIDVPFDGIVLKRIIFPLHI